VSLVTADALGVIAEVARSAPERGRERGGHGPPPENRSRDDVPEEQPA